MTIARRDIEFWWSFFVESRNGPALLRMPDCERLQVLSSHCSTTEADHYRGHIKEQSKQGKSKTNKNSKINPPLDSKNNQEMDYFLAGQEKRNGHGSKFKKQQKTAWHIQCFFRHLVLLRHIFMTGQGRYKACQTPPRHVVYTLQEPFKTYIIYKNKK